MISYDVIVIGGGHAGIEAASASARRGCRTLLLTMDINAIGRLSCNPAIGGMAKGQLVCEIDALGGEMGLLADKSGIQFKILGRSKGPAMWSPRSQNDKDLYPQYAQERLREIENLTLLEGLVEDIVLENGKIAGIHLVGGESISCKAVVLCAGTFLASRMHTGEEQRIGGRVGEGSVENLSGSLRDVGLVTARLKTGTPPRVHKETVDFSVCEADSGDAEPQPFSHRTSSISNKIDCYITRTNAATHDALRKGFDRSPMFTGRITGRGPRYCPSVEDKVFRFAEKESHQIFLEPEGLETDSIYVNGFSTSLPQDIQEKAIRTIPGLKRAEILKYGYAVEYDFFPPHQLMHSMQSKRVPGLFLAGQINGTSGYEEAAAQGLMAGINASAFVRNEAPLVLDRSQGYIGVLIDDLANLSTDEPYRMFTSRAEYRLLLRKDNADLRLTDIGYSLGLQDVSELRRVQHKRQGTEIARTLLNTRRFSIPGEEYETATGAALLRRPELNVAWLQSKLDESDELAVLLNDAEIAEQIEVLARYDGYIERQNEEVAQFKRKEAAQIPTTIDYSRIHALSSEAREKLSRIRPVSLGQAGRISGISRSDLAILMLYIR